MPQVYRRNLGYGFVPRWRLLIVGVRPSALTGREAYITKSGEKFYWLEDLIQRRYHPNGCEFITGDLDGDWSRCNQPRFNMCYCKFHYQLCHRRLVPMSDLLEVLLASMPSKVQGL